jgi:ornithine decarboxylase
MYDAGISHYDVASIAEVKLVHDILPQAKKYYMHPVKPRESIKSAYFDYGVRDFSLDSFVELEKILAATNYAEDLNLYIRINIPNNYAELSLTHKFGATVEDAAELLRHTRKFADKLGICFHVGSQSMHPDAYREAIQIAGGVIRNAGVQIDMLDVGGGFPSKYPGMTPPPLKEFTQAIHREFMKLGFKNKCELMCEPGRALVAECGSVVVRVDLRKGNYLYINDGTYGSLFDAGVPAFKFPVKLIRTKGSKSKGQPLEGFSFYGPTCDSADFMQGPFYLPEDIKEGDYIEVGQLGSYGGVFRTNFNGFGDAIHIESEDKPMLSMYRKQAVQEGFQQENTSSNVAQFEA